MNGNINLRCDENLQKIIKDLQLKLKISKSDIIRMSINHFYNYVKKVNK